MWPLLWKYDEAELFFPIKDIASGHGPSVFYEHKWFASVIPVYANGWHWVIDKVDFKNKQRCQCLEKKKKKVQGDHDGVAYLSSSEFVGRPV